MSWCWLWGTYSLLPSCIVLSPPFIPSAEHWLRHSAPTRTPGSEPWLSVGKQRCWQQMEEEEGQFKVKEMHLQLPSYFLPAGLSLWPSSLYPKSLSILEPGIVICCCKFLRARLPWWLHEHLPRSDMYTAAPLLHTISTSMHHLHTISTSTHYLHSYTPSTQLHTIFTSTTVFPPSSFHLNLLPFKWKFKRLPVLMRICAFEASSRCKYLLPLVPFFFPFSSPSLFLPSFLSCVFLSFSHQWGQWHQNKIHLNKHQPVALFL